MNTSPLTFVDHKLFNQLKQKQSDKAVTHNKLMSGLNELMRKVDESLQTDLETITCLKFKGI